MSLSKFSSLPLKTEDHLVRLLAVTLSHRANFFPILRRMVAIESTNDFVHVNHLHRNELRD
jgi:hypothetical protein